jgi:hypothetical protein
VKVRKIAKNRNCAGVPVAVVRSWRVPDCLGGVGVSLLPDTG